MSPEELDAMKARAESRRYSLAYTHDVPLLLAEIDRLRAALEPFAETARWFDHLSDEHAAIQQVAIDLHVTDFRAARAALGPAPSLRDAEEGGQ